MKDVPKFEFSDLVFNKTVVEGHSFVPRYDAACSNIVSCTRCGLEGWSVWEPAGDQRVERIKSYKPNQPCIGGDDVS